MVDAQSTSSPGHTTAIRSIEIVRPRPGAIALALEDRGHAFRIDFEHDKERITEINAEWVRHPMTTCPGANVQLKQLEGCPLGDNVSDIVSYANPRSHCTHMYDAMAIARVHAHQQRDDCRYDILMRRDLDSGLLNVDVSRNGKAGLSLQIENYNDIVAPARFAGRGIFKGFLQWAASELDSEQFEHGYLIQKAMIVVRDLENDPNYAVGKPASDIGLPEGTCYGSRPAIYQDAAVREAARLFSDEPETEVLNFFNPSEP